MALQSLSGRAAILFRNATVFRYTSGGQNVATFDLFEQAGQFQVKGIGEHVKVDVSDLISGVAGMGETKETSVSSPVFGKRAGIVGAVSYSDTYDPMIFEVTAQMPLPAGLGAPDAFADLIKQNTRNPMMNGGIIRLDGVIHMAPR